MSRSDQRRRRALRAAAPVAGLLAVGLLVWQGSTAAFSATTDNGSENWATGTLTLTNDGGNGSTSYSVSTAALFNDTNLKIPAAGTTKCLNVKAGGTAGGGTLRFYVGAVSGTNSATFAPQVNVTIKASAVTATAPTVPANCTGFVSATNVTPVAGTALSALPATYAAGLGSIAVPAGTQYVTYQIAYNLTSTGTNAGDNALQGSNATAPFNWEIQ